MSRFPAQQRFIGEQLLLTEFIPQLEPTTAALLIAPFAEELNKSRRMMALMARELAARGSAAFYLDVYATGDSAGSFSEARWARWQQDLRHCLDLLAQEYRFSRIDLVGIRLGAIMAAQLAANPEYPWGRLVLWQPVAGGKRYLKQFLRTRVMASMFSGDGQRESVSKLRERLATKQCIQVAGYPISLDLAEDIDELDLPRSLPMGLPIGWFEVQDTSEPQLSPATQQLLGELADYDIHAEAIAGEPFWSTVETAVTPLLLSRTSNWLNPA